VGEGSEQLTKLAENSAAPAKSNAAARALAAATKSREPFRPKVGFENSLGIRLNARQDKRKRRFSQLILRAFFASAILMQF